jgi:hypothetical protein
MAPSPNPQQPSKAARSSKNSSGNGLQSLVKAEKLTQMAFILPVSLLVGWLMGAALDKWFQDRDERVQGAGKGSDWNN